jgi:hypothetical protein
MNMRNQSLDASISHFKFQYYCSKIAISFFATVYLLAGIGMLVVSFWLEKEVFLTILGEAAFVSYLTAACLEAAKLGTIIVYDFIDRKNETNLHAVTFGQQLKHTALLLFKRFFQLSLFLISMLCVATVISKQFDNPKMEEVRKGDLAKLQANYDRSRAELIASQDKEQQLLAAQQEKELTNITARYQPLIDQELRGLETETHNIGPNGVVIGSKYQAHQLQLEKHNTALQNELNAQKSLAAGQTQEQSLSHQKKLAALSSQFNTEQANINNKNYEHENIRAIVKTMDAVLPYFGFKNQLDPKVFVALFALMLSAIVECAIFLALSSFVDVFFPHDFAVIELEMAEAQKKTSRYGLNPDDTCKD